MRKLSGWLATRNVRFLSAKAIGVATPILMWIGLIAFYSVRVSSRLQARSGRDSVL